MSGDKFRKCDEVLDMEYLNTLRNIKPYITCIMNNHYIELVRVWLEKLSDVKVENKTLRNEYLVELGKQIVTGVFVEPFVDPPCSSPLPSFKQSWKKQSMEVTKSSTNPWVQSVNKLEESTSEDQTFTDSHAQHTEIKQVILATHPQEPLPRTTKKSAQERLNEVRENINMMHQYTRDMQTNNGKHLKKKKSKIKTNAKRTVHTVNRQEENVYSDVPYPPQYYPSNELYIPVGRHEKMMKRPPETEDSSWMDLTEVSTNVTVYGSGDATPRLYEPNENIQIRDAYEQKIGSLMAMIDDLKEENTLLNQHVDKYQKDLSLRNTKAETSLNSLTSEVECLKGRLQVKLRAMKTAVIKVLRFFVSEWQNTVATLQKKIAVLQKRYNELKLENNELIKKQEELEAEKRKELAAQKQKLTEFHGRETDMLKEVHAKAITELESKLSQNMVNVDSDYQRKVNDLRESYENKYLNLKDDFDHRVSLIRDEYESKLRSFNADHENILMQKEAEIDKLEQLLQEQCIRMQEEVQGIRQQIESNITNSSESYLEKINFLQKCIVKMEKLYQKAEKENAKQINKLRKELEYKNKTNQLALTTQKAELLAHSLDGKQNEVEQIFANLEDHYRNVIVEHQKKALEDKRQDAKIIEDLKRELAKYRNEY